MQNFKKYLLNKYGKSIKELSETEFGNNLLDYDFQMISWDDVAEDFLNYNNDFNDKFSSVDALYILEKEDKVQLFFFEFKNVNYSIPEDYQMSKFHLNKCIKKMKDCPNDCKLYDDIEKFSERLVDESNVSLRSKPSDSLSLFYFMMNYFFSDGEIDNNCKEKLFKIDKFFFLVSNTEQQYYFNKNKNNRYNTIVRPLSFLKRLEPYHYDMVFSINTSGFNDFFYERNKYFIE